MTKVWYENLEHSRAIVVQTHGICFGIAFLAHEHYMDEFIREHGDGETFSFEDVDHTPPDKDGVYECILTMIETRGSYEDPTPDCHLLATDFKILSEESWKAYIANEWPSHWLEKTS